MQEHVVREGDSIVLRRPVPPGDHIRRRGEDVAPGDLLAMTGQRLDPRHVALLAAQGIATVRVRRRPRVAIVSTGDELLPAGGTCGSASVYDTNRPMLMGLAAGAGLDIADYGCAPDDPEALADVLRAAAAACDLVVTSGGVSVGEEDHSSRALERAGGTGESLRIGMKPGKPALVGRIGAAVYLGLPGNPVSALVSWSLLGRAIIAALEGRRFAPPLGLPVALEGALLRKSGRTEFMPARLAWHDSEPRLQILPGGSARLRPLAEADGFAEVPAHVSTAAAGSTLAFHPFEKLFAP
jgi:molybdopterin molybdotransferase